MKFIDNLLTERMAFGFSLFAFSVTINGIVVGDIDQSIFDYTIFGYPTLPIATCLSAIMMIVTATLICTEMIIAIKNSKAKKEEV